MKKWLAGILVLMICILGITKEAQADVIWEPENSFYKVHVNDCSYHNRNYITNGPDGNVVVYKSPEVNLELALLENGIRVNIYYLYEAKNGVLWGLYDGWDRNITGWIPMEYLDLEYDHICFVEEFGKEMRKETGKLAQEYTGKTIHIWSYPGSENYSPFVLKDSMEYNETFVDEVGNKWGYTGYYYGWRDVWVCIDNPRAGFSELYPDEKPIREVNSEHTIPSGEEIVPTKGVFEIIVIIAVLVIAVVVVTWKILHRMKRKSLDTKDDSYE